MNFPAATTLLTLALAATGAVGAVTTTVVDVPIDGDTQRFLYVKPDAPIANIVSIPGGDGILGIQGDGTMTTFTAACSPIGRVRQALAERGFAVALVDATANGAVRNANGVREVIRHMQGRHDVPTWIVGGSAATNIAANLALGMPAGSPGGVVFFSPGRPPSGVERITLPALVIYHSADTDAFGSSMFNALASSTARERIALTGGTNAGCGFHLFNGLDAQFLAGVAGFIERNNASAPQAFGVQGLWWNSPAESESGWGVNLTQQGETLFATWFTYDADGRGLWLVMSARKVAPNSYSGELYRTTGPPFNAAPFNPSQVVATPVGTATFSFTDADNGTFAYVVNGISQSKPITRQVFSAPLPTCAVGGPEGSAPNYRALWWKTPAESESGWGVNIDHQGDILFATWFTYDAGGRGMWLVMSRGARTGPGAYSGTLYRTTGPAFSASPWRGSSVVATEAGTASFAFTDANNGTFTYTLDGVTQSKPITRQVFAAPVTVCR